MARERRNYVHVPALFTGLGALALGTALYFGNKSDSVKPLHYEEQVQQKTPDDKLSQPDYSTVVREPIQTQKREEYIPKTLEDLLKSSDEVFQKNIYSVLREQFDSSLDRTKFKEREEYFSDDFILDLRGMTTEGALEFYQQRLEALTDKERADLQVKYGEIINFLQANKGKEIEKISVPNGYEPVREVADNLAKIVGEKRRDSLSGGIFPDIIEDPINREEFENFIKVAKRHSILNGDQDTTELESNIRAYQGGIVRYLELERKIDSGGLTDQENEEFEKLCDQTDPAIRYVRDHFSRITGQQKSKEEVKRTITEELDKKPNKLYSFLWFIKNK